MRKVLLLGSLFIVFCSFAFAQEGVLPEDVEPYVAYADENRTVYFVVHETIPAGVLSERFESLEAKVGVSFFDYLSVINIILIMVLFVLLLRQKKVKRQ